MCPEHVVIRVEFVCQLCTSSSSRWLCTVSRVWLHLSCPDTKRQRGWSMAAGRTDILSEVGNLWHASVCLLNQRVTALVSSTAICDLGYRVDTSSFYPRCVIRKLWCVMSSCRRCHHVTWRVFIWSSFFFISCNYDLSTSESICSVINGNKIRMEPDWKIYVHGSSVGIVTTSCVWRPKNRGSVPCRDPSPNRDRAVRTWGWPLNASNVGVKNVWHHISTVPLAFVLGTGTTLPHVD